MKLKSMKSIIIVVSICTMAGCSQPVVQTDVKPVATPAPTAEPAAERVMVMETGEEAVPTVFPVQLEADAEPDSETAPTKQPTATPTPMATSVPMQTRSPGIEVTFAPTPTPAAKPTVTAIPAPTTQPAPTPAQAPTATPVPTAPPTPAPTPIPTTLPTVTPAPAFDINTWISYAQNYAVSVGLNLDSTATECWDNPIMAGPNRTSLEADIQSRLNRYAKDETILDVWVWAESRGDGTYNLYIAYA